MQQHGLPENSQSMSNHVFISISPPVILQLYSRNLYVLSDCKGDYNDLCKSKEAVLKLNYE